MVLCDACNEAYHLKCLNPPLAKIPKGNWYCPDCSGTEKAVSSRRRYAGRPRLSPMAKVLSASKNGSSRSVNPSPSSNRELFKSSPRGSSSNVTSALLERPKTSILNGPKSTSATQAPSNKSPEGNQFRPDNLSSPDGKRGNKDLPSEDDSSAASEPADV